MTHKKKMFLIYLFGGLTIFLEIYFGSGWDLQNINEIKNCVIIDKKDHYSLLKSYHTYHTRDLSNNRINSFDVDMDERDIYQIGDTIK